MIAHGVVVAKHGSTATVRIGGRDGCESCGKCGKYRDKTVTALDNIGVSDGDTVEIEISDRKYGQSIFLMYVCPLLGLIAGVAAGYYIISPLFGPKSVDMVSVLCGIISVLIVYAVVWLFRKSIDKKPVAEVTAITGNGDK